MKILVGCFICTVLFIGCTNHEKDKTSVVTGEEIYMVVNMVIKDLEAYAKIDGTEDDYLQDELTIPSFITDTIELNKYFLKSDLDFIELQYKERKNFILLQDSIKSQKIISKKIIDSFYDIKSDGLRRQDEIIQNYKQILGNTDVTILSLPIFSQDKKRVLIDVSYFFGGGKTMIYRKHNGKWTSDVIGWWI